MLSTYGDMRVEEQEGQGGLPQPNACCHGSAVVRVTSVIKKRIHTSVVKVRRHNSHWSSQGSGLTGAGLDVATRRSTLAAVTSGKTSKRFEITHNNNLPMTAGSMTIPFNYMHLRLRELMRMG
ncbi:MAG: hypothetical protein IPG99_20125 [Ignavibacteria bacterium]|nr:hypothetical protein [Ignavibacteria bacterium]